MKPFFAALGLATLGLVATAAHADVQYELVFSGATIDGEAGAPPLTWGGGFSVSTTEPISGTAVVTPASCFVSAEVQMLLACAPTQELQTNGFNTGYAFIGFGTVNIDGSGGGTGFLFFEPGSFSSNGVHTIYTGTITDGSGFYGNFAAAGTLTVSGVSPVPEPGSLALMGLGVAALLLRRRTR